MVAVSKKNKNKNKNKNKFKFNNKTQFGGAAPPKIIAPSAPKITSGPSAPNFKFQQPDLGSNPKKFGPGMVKRGLSATGRGVLYGTKALGVGTAGAVAGSVSVPLALGYGVAHGAVKLGTTLTKLPFKAAALGYRSFRAKRAQNKVSKKLGIAQPEILKKLAKYEEQKRTLNAERSAAFEREEKKRLKGKSSGKTIAQIQTEYDQKLENLHAKIQVVHNKRQLGTLDSSKFTSTKQVQTPQYSALGTINKTRSVSEQVAEALKKSKNNLTISYEAAKQRYQSDIDAKKKVLETTIEPEKKAFGLAQTDLNLKKQDFDAAKTEWDTLQKNPNFRLDPSYETKLEAFIKTQNEYKASQKVYEEADKSLKNITKQAIKELEIPKGIEFYESKAQTLKNSKDKLKRSLKSDFNFSNIAKRTARIATVGLYKPAEVSKRNSGIQSDYKSTFSDFGKPFGSNALKVAKIGEVLYNKKLEGKNLERLTFNINTLQQELINLPRTPISDLITSIQNAKTPAQKEQFKKISALNKELDAFKAKNPNATIEINKLENTIREFITDYKKGELEGLTLDKSKRQYLLIRAQNFVENVVDKTAEEKSLFTLRQSGDVVTNLIIAKIEKPRTTPQDNIDLKNELALEITRLEKKYNTDKSKKNQLQALEDLKAVKKIQANISSEILKAEINKELSDSREIVSSTLDQSQQNSIEKLVRPPLRPSQPPLPALPVSGTKGLESNLQISSGTYGIYNTPNYNNASSSSNKRYVDTDPLQAPPRPEAPKPQPTSTSASVNQPIYENVQTQPTYGNVGNKTASVPAPIQTQPTYVKFNQPTYENFVNQPTYGNDEKQPTYENVFDLKPPQPETRNSSSAPAPGYNNARPPPVLYQNMPAIISDPASAPKKALPIDAGYMPGIEESGIYQNLKNNKERIPLKKPSAFDTNQYQLNEIYSEINLPEPPEPPKKINTTNNQEDLYEYQHLPPNLPPKRKETTPKSQNTSKLKYGEFPNEYENIQVTEPEYVLGRNANNSKTYGVLSANRTTPRSSLNTKTDYSTLTRRNTKNNKTRSKSTAIPEIPPPFIPTPAPRPRPATRLNSTAISTSNRAPLIPITRGNPMPAYGEGSGPINV